MSIQMLLDQILEAAMDDNVERLEALLTHTDVSVINQLHPETERTALHMAAAWDARHTAQMLLEHGAQIAIVDPDGQTPLHLAAASNSVATLRVLLEAIPSSECYQIVNRYNRNGYTALHLAAEQGLSDCCKTLLVLGQADPGLGLLAMPHATAMDLAMLAEHHEVVQVLRDRNN